MDGILFHQLENLLKEMEIKLSMNQDSLKVIDFDQIWYHS